MIKKKKSQSPYERFAALSSSRKEALYRELDDPNIAQRAKPMDSRNKKLWARAKNKGGRPRVGRGAARVLISIERGLLETADAFAKRQHITRSQLFSQGIHAVMAKAS